MKTTTKTTPKTTTKATPITYNNEQLEIRKGLKSINTKSNNLDSKISNNVLLNVVNYLKGKNRDNYPQLKRDLKANLNLGNYANSVLNVGFEYKENKLISNIELLPFTTIKKLVNMIKQHDDKKQKELLELIAKSHNSKDDMKSYKKKIEKIILDNKVHNPIKIDVKKESEKLIENCSQKELLELIATLQKATKTTLKKVS